jgi:prophage antirepressor-like protein
VNAIQVFDFRGAHVRTAGTLDAPLFCAADVCTVLEIANSRDAVNRLDQDEVELVSVQHASGTKKASFVNESGLYSLILGSRKPEAKAFKRWVTAELLPALRQRGHYSLPGAPQADVVAMFEQRFAALLEPVLETMATVAKTVAAISGATIPPLEATLLKDDVRKIAKMHVAAGAAKNENSARRRIYNRLSGALGWFGTGRNWKALPLHKLPDAKVLIAEMKREAEQMGPTAEERQLKLLPGGKAS